MAEGETMINNCNGGVLLWAHHRPSC